MLWKFCFNRYAGLSSHPLNAIAKSKTALKSSSSRSISSPICCSSDKYEYKSSPIIRRFSISNQTVNFHTVCTIFSKHILLSPVKLKLFQTQIHFFSKTNSSSLGESRTCWKCGMDTNPNRELFFCKCGIVQATAPSLTYFDILQQEPSFELDQRSLGVMFRDTQRLLHPDKFSTKSKEEQQIAEEQSSLVNKAYQTLLKPLSRAKYMLQLQNVTIDENDTISDPEFLMDIMDINEQIDEASSAADINSVEDANNNSINDCIQELVKAFKENRITDAKSLTIKLRYFTTISERILDLKRRELG